MGNPHSIPTAPKIHKETRYLEQWASCLIPFTTEEIGSNPLFQSGKVVQAMHTIPLALPLQLPERHLPIDPYLLGLWLGDGTSNSADITCHPDDEPHYRKRALAAGEKLADKEVWRTGGRYSDLHSIWRTSAPILDQAAGTGGQGKQAHSDPVPAVPATSNGSRCSTASWTPTGTLTNGDWPSTRRYPTGWRSESWKLALTLGQKAVLGKGVATLDGSVTSDKWRVGFTPTIYPASLPRKTDRLTGFLERREGIPLTRLSQR